MEDWPAVVAKWFDDNDPDASLTRVAPSGNSPERISSLERTLGVTLPEQMRKLYLAVDGFDLCDKPGEPPTFVKSVDAIPDYAKQERSCLSDTHREFAENYLPFIDFGNGDSAGYVWVSKGEEQTPVFVMVEHEEFRYDPDQSIDDFVRVMPENLAEMFAST